MHFNRCVGYVDSGPKTLQALSIGNPDPESLKPEALNRAMWKLLRYQGRVHGTAGSP